MFPELIFEDACVAFEDKRYEKAEKGFRLVLSQEPSHAPSLYFLGQIAMERGATEAAVGLFYEAYTADSKNQNYIYALAVSLQETGRADEALSYYKRIADLPQVQNAMGVIYQQQGHLVKAKHAFQKAVQKDPHNANAWTNLGAMCLAASQTQEAKKYLKKAIACDAAQGNAHILLSQLLLGEGQVAAAKKCCLQGLDVLPNYAPLWQMLGRICQKQQQWAQALDAIQKAVGLDLYNETLLYDKGVVLEQLQRTDEAEQAYRDSLRLNPSFAPSVNKLAILLHKKGVSVEALELYRQLIRENPNDGEALLNMAIIVSDVGDYETAAGLFVLLLSKHLYEDQAHQALAKLLPVWAQQDKKQAQQYALGWWKNFPDNALAQRTYAKLFDKKDVIV